jgi:cephalosporin-C deacetylase
LGEGRYKSVTDTRPTDFDQYWTAVLDELANTPSAPEVERVPIRDTDYATQYSVRLTSIGPYRIFAYVSVPKGDGPFPALYFAPGYGSVVANTQQGMPNGLRRDHIVFVLAARGQRNSDKPYAASFPGLLTDGIDDPSAYRYRGIVADAVRGLGYLASRSDVDANRVAVLGSDMPLVIAGLSTAASHVVDSPAIFYKAVKRAAGTQAYPLEELNDYIRLFPERRDAVERTMSYFDTRWFASSVKAKTLVLAGAKGEPLSRDGLQPLLDNIGDNASVYEAGEDHSTYKEGVYKLSWLAKEFRLGAPVLPEHWQ